MKGRTTRRSVVILSLFCLVAAACGSDPATDEGSPAGESCASAAPLSGDLTFFAYEDAFEPALLDPSEEANPEVDVVNVCVEDTVRMVNLGLLQPIEKKPLLRSLVNGDADQAQLFRSDEIDVVVPGYKGSTETLKKEGEPVEYSLASEGQLTWTCGYAIGTNAANVDAAYALINHYAQPETQACQAENFFYLVSNEGTLAVVPPKIVDEARPEDPGNFENAIPYSIPENYDDWVTVWREFKAA